MGDTTSLPSRKAVLRKELRWRRLALAPSLRRAAARRAAAHLAREARRTGARHVAAFLATAGEIDTAPVLALLLRQGCALYVPRIGRDGTMRFTRLAGALRRNRFGIAEPVARTAAPRLDLILLPLVAFDAQGRRLGMGGGYYDRLLDRPRSGRRPLRVGYAFAAQEIAAVPVAAHDARLDAVVTECGLRRFR